MAQKRHVSAALLCILGAVLWLTACSDGPAKVQLDQSVTTADGSKPTTDQSGPAAEGTGPVADVGGPAADGPVGPKPDQTVPSDGSVKPDLPAATVCEAACVAEDISLCVTSPSTSKCVECTDSKQCAANPGAYGPVCDGSFCTCSTDADCATSKRGPKCEAYNAACSCQTSADCKAPYTDCRETEYGFKACYPPCTADKDCPDDAPKCNVSKGTCYQCTADADCSKNTSAKLCNTTTGMCVACKSSADCTAGICDVATGTCVECTASSDCTDSPWGTTCIDSWCSCTTDAECKGTYVWGSKCDTSADIPGCSCTASSECSGNAHGPTCETFNGICTCAADAECTKSPYTECAPISASAPYLSCQKACSTDADCPSTLKHCSGGKCMACLSDADCASQTTKKFCESSLGVCVACRSNANCGGSTPICDTALGKCVGCKTSADCAANPLGTSCNNGYCECTADTDCQGTYVWGAKCNSSDKTCGCTGNSDCAGSAHGPTCVPAEEVCTCTSDAQCTKAPYTKCAPIVSSTLYMDCEKPCASDADCATRGNLSKCVTGRCVACAVDADCASSTSGKACNTTVGVCVGCSKDAHCSGSTPVCNTSTGKCMECKSNADCASNPSGAVCSSSGTCGCAAATDCAGAYTYGPVCTSSKKCGCSATTDCAGAPSGPTCKSSKCTCAKDAECTKTPYTLCTPYSITSALTLCRQPCTADSDCAKLSGLPKCDSGKCVECVSNNDCAANTSEKICGADKECVECRSSADCASSPYGSACPSGYCACATDADCVTASGGKICETSFEMCSCNTNADCPASAPKCTNMYYLSMCE